MSKLMMLVVVAMVLAGCNTMNGVGKDMEKAGEAVQRKSSQ
ncbi:MULTISPECIES: entericidin A/B family lipoprotein [Methylophilus]|jgi:entericidin B|uniref:Entericidin A/B family lipoprotein n=1 Tax=Methylophilus luteus TaxID=640108 RepID=A0ABW3F5G1_9PROT